MTEPAPFEVIPVHATQVACDGDGGALGHPRVYLHIDHAQGDQITCPYCSRTFRFVTDTEHAA